MHTRNIKRTVVALLAVGALLALTAGCERDQRTTRRDEPDDGAPVGTGAPADAQRNVLQVAQGHERLRTFSRAVQAAGLTEDLQREGPYTVFAPSDEAFNRLPAGTLDALLQQDNREKLSNLLKHHIVEGRRLTSGQFGDPDSIKPMDGPNLYPRRQDGALTVGQVRVLQPDIGASNGVIHVIDSVLVPEGFEMPGQQPRQDGAPRGTGEPGEQTISQLAQQHPQLRTFSRALQTAGLSEALQAEGPYTVFAPSDEAFNKLPQARRDDLLRPENRQQLSSLLRNHVVSRKLAVSDLSRIQSVDVVGGRSLDIRIENGMLMIQGAHVTQPNIEASNGYIHIIDTVMLAQEAPEQPDGQPRPNGQPQPQPDQQRQPGRQPAGQPRY